MLTEETVEEDIDTTKLSEAELKDYMRQQTKPTIHTLKLVLKSILLDFSSFPFKSHSAVNIEASCVCLARLCSALSLLCLWLFGLIALHRIALHCIASRSIAPHCIAWHRTASHRTALHRIALHCIASHCIASHCIALNNTTLLVCCRGVDSRFVGEVRALSRGLSFVRPRRRQQRHQGAEASESAVSCVRRARSSDVSISHRWQWQ